MKRSLTIITSLFITFSCTSPQEQIIYEVGDLLPHLQRIDGEHRILDIENAEFVDYASLVEDVQYIPLGNEQGYITEMTEVIYHKKKYYISDKRQEAVFIFDETGKCLKKLEKGKGHGEFLAVANIDVNKEQDELIVFDRFSNKMLCYDLDGNFKYTRNIKHYRALSLWAKDSTFVHLIDPMHGIGGLKNYGCMITKGDSIIIKGFKYLPVQIGFCGEDNLRRGYNCIYYRPLFSDSIYTVNSDSTFSLAWNAKLKNSVWEKYSNSDKFVNVLDEPGDVLFPWFYENKDFFIGYTKIPEEEYMTFVIYDKNKNKTNLAKGVMYDNIKQLDRFYGYAIMGIKDDYFIITATSFNVQDDLKSNLKNGTLKVTDPKLEKLIRESGDGNPILVLTKFKSI